MFNKVTVLPMYFSRLFRVKYIVRCVMEVHKVGCHVFSLLLSIIVAT